MMSMRRVVAGLFVILPALMPLSVQAAERQVVATQDGDYFSFDLRTGRDVTLERCEQTCIG